MRIFSLKKFYHRFIFFNMDSYDAEKILKFHDLLKSGRGRLSENSKVDFESGGEMP